MCESIEVNEIMKLEVYFFTSNNSVKQTCAFLTFTRMLKKSHIVDTKNDLRVLKHFELN